MSTKIYYPSTAADPIATITIGGGAYKTLQTAGKICEQNVKIVNDYEYYDGSLVTYNITTTLTNCIASASNPTTIESGGTATLTFTANSGYALPDTITISGASYTWTKSTGTVALNNPTTNTSITIMATIAGYNGIVHFSRNSGVESYFNENTEFYYTSSTSDLSFTSVSEVYVYDVSYDFEYASYTNAINCTIEKNQSKYHPRIKENVSCWAIIPTANNWEITFSFSD